MADAWQATSRLHDVFTAELLEDTSLPPSSSTSPSSPQTGLAPNAKSIGFGDNTGTGVVDDTHNVAIRVRNAEFTWDAPPPALVDDKAKKDKRGAGAGAKENGKGRAENATGEKAKGEKEWTEEENIFRLSSIDLEIPKGKVGYVFANRTFVYEW
jgi:hypothetical protein